MSEYKPVKPNSIGGQALIEGRNDAWKGQNFHSSKKNQMVEIEVKIDEIKKGKNNGFLKLPSLEGLLH